MENRFAICDTFSRRSFSLSFFFDIHHIISGCRFIITLVAANDGNTNRLDYLKNEMDPPYYWRYYLHSEAVNNADEVSILSLIGIIAH